MLLVAYTLFDEVAEVHYPPIFCKNENEARRLFVDCCNDPKTIAGEHPEDYRLYRIGVFNDNTGMFEPVEPQLIVKGVRPNG